MVEIKNDTTKHWWLEINNEYTEEGNGRKKKRLHLMIAVFARSFYKVCIILTDQEFQSFGKNQWLIFTALIFSGQIKINWLLWM